MTIEIKHQVLTTVDTTSINLPYCFTTNQYAYSDEVVMITEELKTIRVFLGEGHCSMIVTQRTEEDIQKLLDSTFKDYKVTELTMEQFQERINKFITQAKEIKL